MWLALRATHDLSTLTGPKRILQAPFRQNRPSILQNGLVGPGRGAPRQADQASVRREADSGSRAMASPRAVAAAWREASLVIRRRPASAMRR